MLRIIFNCHGSVSPGNNLSPQSAAIRKLKLHAPTPTGSCVIICAEKMKRKKKKKRTSWGKKEKETVQAKPIRMKIAREARKFSYVRNIAITIRAVRGGGIIYRYALLNIIYSTYLPSRAYVRLETLTKVQIFFSVSSCQWFRKSCVGHLSTSLNFFTVFKIKYKAFNFLKIEYRK